MGIPLDARGNPLRSPTEQELKKISGGLFGHDRRGEYAQSSKDVQEARQKSTEESNKVLELTAEYYNLRPLPQYKSGYSVSGPSWERNKLLIWAPKFSDRPNINDADKDEEALKRSYADNPAFIREDGAIIFRDAAFLDDFGRPAPGSLASLLYHEYYHVVDALTPESERINPKNEPATEVRHRLWQLTSEDIFELPSYDWKQDLKNLVWQNELSKMWRDAIEIGKDPYNPDDRKQIFDAFAITPDRERQIDAQVDHDLTLMANTDPDDVESLERLKSQAQSDFNSGISDDNIRDLVRGWKSALELEAHHDQRREQEAEAVKAQAIADAVRKVRSCGFQPQYKADGNFNGFRREIRGWPATYTITHAMTLDEFKAGLWFSSLCFDITMQPQDTPPEQSDTRVEGFEIASAHWNETGFKADSQFDVVPEQQARCVNYLHDHWKPSMDPKALKHLYSEAEKEYQKGVDSSWRATQRERKEEDDADRAQRERQENQGQSGGSRSGSAPVQGQPRAPIHCGFDANGAYCR